MLLLAAGLIAAARRGSLTAGLVCRAAGGMLVMVVNLRGDINGFITPVMALLWPIAGYGLDATARGCSPSVWSLRVEALGRSLPSLRGIRLNVGYGLLAAAMAIPITNLFANYAAADQSGKYGSGTCAARDVRAVAGPGGGGGGRLLSGFRAAVPDFDGRGGFETRPRPSGVRGREVRAAVRDGPARLCALRWSHVPGNGGSAVRADEFYGRRLDEWLGSLHEGTIVVGATAHTPVPRELFDARHRQAVTARPARPFNAFALVVGRPDIESREDSVTALLAVDPALLKLPLPGLPGRLEASADASGARIQLAGRTVAGIDYGMALSVFAPDGSLLNALTLPAGQAPAVPLESSVYELRGEAPCVSVSTGGWSDVSPAFGTGSVLTSLSGFGSVAIETELAASGGDGVRAAELLGAGDIRTVDRRRSSDGSEAMVTELVRTRSRRPAFRLAFDSPARSGRARLRPGGIQSSISLCAHVPPGLFSNGDSGAVTPHFDEEAYFGAGWSGPERSSTGTVRRGVSGATLLLPLDAGDVYRVTLDVVGSPATPLEIRLNGETVSACAPRARVPCDVTLPARLVRTGVNAVTVSIGESALTDAEPMPLTFRGAHIRRLKPGSGTP